MVVALAATASGVSAQTSSSPSLPIAGQPSSVRVTLQNVRLNNYLHDLAGTGSFVGVLGGGLLDHFRQRPAAWSDDGDGLVQRIGARATQAAVQVSVRHALAAMMHRSTDYQPCDCRGIGPRIVHALLETFTDRAADGSRALSVPRIAGAYAGGFSRLVWEPHRNAGDVVLGTTLSLGCSAVFNIARELIGIGR
jgi:hypothetical protein